jgi:hypothetical protein
MLKSRTKKYNDESDENTFRFVFYCDQCGSEYHPPPIAFTGDGTGSERDLKWKAEHVRAFARADCEAATRFYRCPLCGEYVCGECVESVWENDEIVRDVCRVCYGKERGNRIKRAINATMKPEPPPAKTREPTTEPKPVTRQERGCSLWKKVFRA